MPKILLVHFFRRRCISMWKHGVLACDNWIRVDRSWAQSHVAVCGIEKCDVSGLRRRNRTWNVSITWRKKNDARNRNSIRSSSLTRRRRANTSSYRNTITVAHSSWLVDTYITLGLINAATKMAPEISQCTDAQSGPSGASFKNLLQRPK